MFGFLRQTQKPARPQRLAESKPRLEILETREVPALFANADVYAGEAGRVLTVPGVSGVLANDFSDTFPGQVLTAFRVSGPNYVGDPRPFPANSLFLDPDGGFRLIIPESSEIPFGVTQARFVYQATNTAGEVSQPAPVTINIGLGSTPVHRDRRRCRRRAARQGL